MTAVKTIKMFSGSALEPPSGDTHTQQGLIYTSCPNSLPLFLNPAAKVATLNLHVHDRGNKLNFTVPSTYRDLACRQLLKLRSAARSRSHVSGIRALKICQLKFCLPIQCHCLLFLVNYCIQLQDDFPRHLPIGQGSLKKLHALSKKIYLSQRT